MNWRDHLKIHPAAELFPLMPEAELRELGENIKARGGRLIQAIHLYKGQLLDGRNRLDAMELVGFAFDDAGLNGLAHHLPDSVDPYEYVIAANLHRRHLTSEQKRDLIAKMLKAKPGHSNRQIAKQVKADDKTVASVRSALESTAEIPQLKKVTGKDGKARPVKVKKKSTIPSVSPVPPVPIKAAPTASEAKPAIPTKATDLARIADLARDCRGLLAHPEQNADEIRKKLSQIIKLSDPNPKGRGTKSAASNAKLDPKLFRRAMALETEDTSARPAGNDVDTQASADERRAFYAAAGDEAMIKH